MNKLISMTNFILENYPKGAPAILFHNYAEFLKQILAIWMFVPAKLVDGVWIVLEEPNINEFKSKPFCESGLCKAYENEVKEHQEAKDRVLFEGFRLEGKYLWHKESLFMISDNYNESFANIKQIEWLLSNSMQEFYLTETAKQQIGL